ncbi:MAG TPA: tripartite tricarboxylate transporter substrate-binding protein [Ramlibacter sp.]|nr:tripartite tricarboxylate transporter substrate-binding protein [Ramlibacter sp.]
MLIVRRIALAFVSLALAGNVALAQTFPNKPLRLIVPYPPASVPDILARLVAESVGTRLKQPVVVENRAGAGGTIAADAAAKSAPDGYTLLVGDSGPLAIAPWIYPRISYAPARDFAAVASLVAVPLVMVVPRASTVRSPADFVAQAKVPGAGLYYGSLGMGSIHHLAAEVFSAATGMKLVHVPYKSNAELTAAVVNGDVQMAFSGIPAVDAFIKEGRMRAAGVTTARRSNVLPEVRTFQEQGIQEFEVAPTIGIVAPAGVPADRLKLLEEAFLAALKEPKVAERLDGLGMMPRPAGAAAYAATIAAELDRFGKVVKAAGIQPQ